MTQGTNVHELLDATLPDNLQGIVSFEQGNAAEQAPPEPENQTMADGNTNLTPEQIRATATEAAQELLNADHSQRAIAERIETLTKDAHDARGETEKAQAELATATEKIETLEGQVEEKDKAIATASEKVETLEAEKAEADKKVEAAEKAKAEAEQKLAKIETESAIVERKQAVAELGEPFNGDLFVKKVTKTDDDGVLVMSQAAFEEQLEEWKAISAFTTKPNAEGENKDNGKNKGNGEGEQASASGEGEQGGTPAAPDTSAAGQQPQARAAASFLTRPETTESGRNLMAGAFGVAD